MLEGSFVNYVSSNNKKHEA